MDILKRLKEKQKGYEYAAGFLSQEGHVEMLELDIEQSKDFGTFDYFDEGVQEAITEYKFG